MASRLTALYSAAILTPSDINEHVPVLAEYAARCDAVLELGVRSCVSSWGLLMGLLHNRRPTKILLAADLEKQPAVHLVADVAREHGVEYRFAECNDLALQTDPVDLTFIDTWHVYGQLRRELAKFAPLTRKYILMHDTQIDGELGESVRRNWDAAAQARDTGIPEHEIRMGMRPAIHEFLAAHPEWTLQSHLTNNNGLTILARTHRGE